MSRLVFGWALIASVLAAGLFPSGAFAALSGARVEALQMPAWVEREGQNIPLKPGMALRDGDRVRTAGASRVLLRLSEGSAVKLGENASLVLEGLHVATGTRLFAGSMKVLEGAFRFTTDAFRKTGVAKRDINITIATATIGVRGTDLWGKATRERDIVLLIEGRIEVQRGSEAAVLMDQPLSLYLAPRGQPALPVSPVDSKQLELWAAETEIQPGNGTVRRSGNWKVVLASFSTRGEAANTQDELRSAGYAADIRRHSLKGKSIYRVLVSKLASRAEAQALAESLRGKMGVAQPVVEK